MKKTERKRIAHEILAIIITWKYWSQSNLPKTLHLAPWKKTKQVKK